MRFLVFCLLIWSTAAYGQSVLEPIDIYDIEYVSDPQISDDGAAILYVRNFKDIMTDRNLSNIWLYQDGMHRPVTSGSQNDYSPRWSPDGNRMIFISNRSGKSQIYMRWPDTEVEARLTNLQQSPSNLSWSPDGRWIAFSMFVPEKANNLVSLSGKPNGADWADEPVFIEDITYRSDGQGYLKAGNRQLFLLSADGGHPRQLTKEAFDHGGTISWSPDSKHLYFSANRHDDHELNPLNSEIHRLELPGGQLTTLTDRQGPDASPVVSPDGTTIAYLGFDDQYLGYQVRKLYVMNADGSSPRLLSGGLDRDVSNPQWAQDGSGLFFQYDDEGNTKVAFISLQGKVTDLARNVGGLSLGRPYSGGVFSVADNGTFAFTHSTPDHPADLATGNKNGEPVERLTRLNDDLFSYKQLGEVEEFWFTSGYDQRRIQGWIVKPPGFDSTRKYPLLLEIHGGPFANYGSRFSAEVQLYAATDKVVLYTNPRGSTSYGQEFGNLIHHNYPSQDYDDLMAGVDAVVARGYIDTGQLYITGGSGGGVLTAWTIGKTDRFRAAVVAKPVINWYSFVLHADNPAFFYKYWFPGYPWEHQDHYMARSPISLVGNVTTPTMLLTGEQDYRTPMSETEQYYAALKIQEVPASMVRIQESGHGIANKPSNLIAKVQYILGWFDKYGAKP